MFELTTEFHRPINNEDKCYTKQKVDRVDKIQHFTRKIFPIFTCIRHVFYFQKISYINIDDKVMHNTLVTCGITITTRKDR